MKSLYERILADNNVSEGILSDIEDTIGRADNNVDSIAFNAAGSHLRTMFSIDDKCDSPFEISNSISGKHLEVKPMLNLGRSVVSQRTVWLFATKDRLSDYISNVTSMTINGPCNIIASDVEKNICKHITAASFDIKTSEIQNAYLSAKVIERLGLIPKIAINAANPVITNCQFEIDCAESSSGRLICYGIPTFNNVKSKTIQLIDITSNKEIVFAGDKKIDLFTNKKWNLLFDFGYSLKYCVGKNYDETKAVSLNIKSMKDLKKLCTNKDFYSRTYNEWPYRLKNNAKLSDFIDISKFNNLQRVNIYDGKFCVLFEKVGCMWDRYRQAYTSAFTDMLKTTYDQMHPEYNKSNIVKHIPVTADGWRVILIRE